MNPPKTWDARHDSSTTPKDALLFKLSRDTFLNLGCRVVSSWKGLTHVPSGWPAGGSGEKWKVNEIHRNSGSMIGIAIVTY